MAASGLCLILTAPLVGLHSVKLAFPGRIHLHFFLLCRVQNNPDPPAYHLLFIIVIPIPCNILEIFALCKGDNFNIHIWAWFGYFKGKSGSIYNLVKN